MTDNSLSKARSLGTLGNKAVVRKDLVGPRDRLDFYKFTLNRSSNVKLQLSGLQANADLIVFNRAGKAIAQSRRGGKVSELINRKLAAGTYYVQVLNRSKGGTKYKLTSVATVASGGGSSIPSGTRANPIDLGTLTTAPVKRSQDTAEFLSEKKKYYKFQMGQIGTVDFRLSQVTGSGAVELYYDSNRNGTLDFTDKSISFSAATGSESNNQPGFFVLPAAGTYFVSARSESVTNNVQYDLTLTPTLFPGNLLSDPGPEETTAYNLGTLNKGSSLEIKDYIGTVDGKDVYRFNLSAASKLNYNKLETAGSIFSVYSSLVYDKNNNGLKDAGDPEFYFANVTNSSVDLQSGNYFLFVDQGNAAYSVTLGAS